MLVNCDETYFGTDATFSGRLANSLA